MRPPTAAPGPSRAARRNASRSHGRSSIGRACCCSTSRSRDSIRRPLCGWARRWPRSMPGAEPSCSRPTTSHGRRNRRPGAWSSPTAACAPKVPGKPGRRATSRRRMAGPSRVGDGGRMAAKAASAAEASTGAFRALCAIVAKDLRLELRRIEGLATVAIFALLVSLMFVFAGDPTPADLRRLGPGALWIALLFAGALGFARWFAQEERNAALQGLLLTPVDRAALFAGKWLGATLFLLVIEAILVPATLEMYGIAPGRAWGWLALLLVVVTVGYAALGTFFAAVAARTTAGELLLPILLFPLSVPLVLAGAEGAQALLAGDPAAFRDWLGLALAFDLLFGTVCTLAFEHVIEE